MRSFLIKLSWFILPMCILSMVLDFVISNQLKQSSECVGEFEVMNDIYQGGLKTDIAIYGSSRAWVHIDPKIINDTLNMSAYNFGIDGHNFLLQYWRHKELLKFNRKPKVIVLSVDVFTLGKRKDLFNPDQFLPYMLWNSDIREFTSSYEGYKAMDYYLPLIRYSGRVNRIRASLKALFKSADTNRLRYRGFAGQEREWNEDFEKAKLIQKSFKSDLDAKSLKLFEKFIIECHEAGINLVLVYTPEYIEGQSFVTNRKEIIDLYDGYSKKYGLVFLNYSDDKLSYQKELFYNVLHLNKNGAELFSKKLAHDLKKSIQTN